MLEIHDLHKRYDDIVALDGCTFTVEPGRMLGFLGRNGAGKTTTMRAIFGLLQPDRGEVRWNGHVATAADRNRFGYMPEERGLYPKMKIADQLTYFGRLNGMSARTAKAEATRWLEELGLGDRMGDALENLSQGNQQRVQLAVALIHQPDLLVLDEPFNGLDPVAADLMARILTERAAAGVAVVFSSHQLEVVEHLCEDVAIIDRGRIVLSGSVDELQSSSPHRVVELDLSGDRADVLAELDGVLDATFDGRRHILRVSRDLDVAQLLRRIDITDGVEHLSYTTPSLTDLFTDAVSDGLTTSTRTQEVSA